ncbi:beta-glucuronidase isoform X2 [Condylostylus longicornis]|nr:beta-glucuronidase isoform X2 [Condylostylus longicornis]
MGVIGYLVLVVLSTLIFNMDEANAKGLLYPQESETRELRSLDGIWNFVKCDSKTYSQGVIDGWYLKDLSEVKKTIPMPVPASYNDITTDASLRDHVGSVWYDRKFFIPKQWEKDYRVMIRFGSVHYDTIVWINGNEVVKHSIGHLPFEAEISDVVKFGQENRITVLVDNVLLDNTVPQGTVAEENTDLGYVVTQSYTFDFFNYAGIHRSVHLYTTPKIFVEDIDVKTEFEPESREGNVKFNVKVGGIETEGLHARVIITGKGETEDHSSSGSLVNSTFSGEIKILEAKPWWPYLMDPNPGYLYKMTVKIFDPKTGEEKPIDVYRLNIGIRTLSWNETSFLINGKPIYFRGFGRHEDSDIRGKGLDYALISRDFNLLKWVGANAYRTSHYPYSEESMQFADEHGIMIIDECPSVDTVIYTDVLLENHKKSLQELIRRDKNHPSAVMWSIANEPRTADARADKYFMKVAQYVRSLDSTRPVTAAIAVGADDDKAAKHLDIVSFNRYNGWYAHAGKLDMITSYVMKEAEHWHDLHKKPILMSEYGADTVEGLHLLPAFVWTEEYQSDLYSKHFKAFDKLRQKGWFIGEFVWNFADFKTAQTVTRVGGNKKGIFTRNRQPKAAAHLLRKRYFALGRELDNCDLPDDLYQYVYQTALYRDISDL